MSTGEYKAQMALSDDGTDWKIYVVITNRGAGADIWPEARQPAAKGIPTRAARIKALAELGFVLVGPDNEDSWEWIEADNEDGTVQLIAATKVRAA